MEAWTVRRMVAWMQADFEKRGIFSARLEADLLLAHALGVKRIALFLDPDRPLMDAELTRVRALVERRRKHEPIAYILGEREFYGRAFEVTRDVLIPRPDTETLVNAALAFLKTAPEGDVLDLCTGSGAVAVSLAAEQARALFATDISAPALAIARKNAERHQVKVELHEGDLFADLRGPFACVVANPPYVTREELKALDADVRDWEPRLALDGGDSGLDFYRRIADEVGPRLVPGGAVFVEVGASQAADVGALFSARGLSALPVERDLAGIDRVVGARRD